MQEYVSVKDESELQADRPDVIAQVARDVRAVGDILQDLAGLQEEGASRVEPRQLYLLSDALGLIAGTLDRVGDDA